ncbi:MAG: hypothetical protein V4736_11265 [Bdellovibrionota bacterium]
MEKAEALRWNQSFLLKEGSPAFTFQGFTLVEPVPSLHNLRTHPVESIELGSQSPCSIRSLWLSFFPEVPAVALAELWTHPVFSSIFKNPVFAEKIGFRDLILLEKLLDLINVQSGSHKAWLAAKKISVNDLRFLTGFHAAKNSEVLELLQTLDASKSQTLMFWERSLEVLGMEMSLASIKGMKDFDQAYQELTKLRFPTTHARDEQKKSSDLSWPSGVKSKWSRRGDKGGFELSLFVSHPAELERQLRGLKSVVDKWTV